MTFAGLYINLDRSADRRERLELTLSRLGLGSLYRRLPATDGNVCGALPPLNAGEHGCYLSHLRALEAAAKSGAVTHIIEDDAILSPRIDAVISAATGAGLFDRFDMVFLDFSIPYGVDLWRQYRQAIKPGELSILDISKSGFAAMASYAVSPRGAQRVRELCASALRESPHPIDLLVRDEANRGNLRAGALFPFPTTVHLGDAYRSTIRVSDTANFHLAMNVLRYSFFVHADISGFARPYIEALREVVAAMPNSGHNSKIREVLDFVEGRL